MIAAPAAKLSTAPARRLRVMVVDDAVVVRGLLGRWIEAEPDLQLVSTRSNGRDALDHLERDDPDVVVLDIEMPQLDGVSALPLLLQKKPDLVVIMASTMTRRGAEISLKALALGAADCILKPTAGRDIVGSNDFRHDVIARVRALGARRLRASAPRLPSRTGAIPRVASAPFKLRPFGAAMPRVLVVGASTGGPQALMTLLADIPTVIERAPVLITQHMPPTFTTILAEHLSRTTRRPAREAVDGEEIKSANIFLAPGNKHMTVARVNGTPVVRLSDAPPVNFCKPAVDPLFTSASQVWGPWVLGLVLTGMGSDGAAGAAAIAKAGGSVIAQDETTSVIWGMPAQAAATGACSAVLPLPEIGQKLTRLFGGDPR